MRPACSSAYHVLLPDATALQEFCMPHCAPSKRLRGVSLVRHINARSSWNSPHTAFYGEQELDGFRVPCQDTLFTYHPGTTSFMLSSCTDFSLASQPTVVYKFSNDSHQTKMNEEDLWLSQDEDEVGQELECTTDPAIFNLSLTYRGGESGGQSITSAPTCVIVSDSGPHVSSTDIMLGYHVRNKDGELQRAVVSAFHGGFSKKPSFTVGCEAKVMIHGRMSPTSTKRATLLVYEFRFISRRNTRIKEADILFEFRPLSTSSGSVGPTVSEVRPKGEHRMEETAQTEASKLGLSFNIGSSIPGVDAGLTMSGEQSASKDTKHHTIVTGDNPADMEWGDHFQAQFTLAENRSQESGIPTELTVVILLERDNDEDFEMIPQIRVTPDFKTMIASLASSRAPDEPIHFSVREPPFNKIAGITAIDPESLGATDLEGLWVCTLYNLYGKAVKGSESAGWEND